jgi:hypothetical protein
MIEKLMWSEGGTGFGICSVGASLIWALDRPGPDKPDLKSVVTVHGSPDDFTDEELAKLVEFSEERTARYDEIFRWRRGANLILIGKPSHMQGKWLRKRLTWDHGPMYSDSLEEAIEIMSR